VCRRMPTWKDQAGRKRVFVPTSLMPEHDEKDELRHAFYLDTGPLFLVFSGLLDADDPLMADAREWFRAGPQRSQNRYDGNCWQLPVLNHEMSSCEPAYSWNVFHAHQMGDRYAFMSGMYSLFAGSLSRKTWISCETRGGITGNVFSAPLAIYMARLAVIDDQVCPDELHLLRMMPLAWAGPNDACRFENVPTEFGNVTLLTQVGPDGRTLKVTWKPRFEAAPRRVVLHVPPVKGLKTVTVNEQSVRPRAGTVTL